METVAFLDTHILVWLYAGAADLLSATARKHIEEATLLVSPMALLEIDYLYETRQIRTRGQALYQALSAQLGLDLAEDSLAAIVQRAACPAPPCPAHYQGSHHPPAL
ncbi:MAG: hypothetical protein HYV03_03905 [Deltaproteobacteria bacterium]|nr:hypothetical protein [Deltaproteobacteria bacterium]